MTDIKKLKARLQKIDVEKENIRNMINETTRSNATSRKIELGVHLLKLAETDITVYAALSKVWEVAKAKRPNAFIDVDLPESPELPNSLFDSELPSVRENN